MHLKVYKIRRTEQIFGGSFKMCFLINSSRSACASASLWARQVEWTNAMTRRRCCIWGFATGWEGSFNCTKPQCLSGTFLWSSVLTTAALCPQCCRNWGRVAGVVSGAKSCQHDPLSALVPLDCAAPQHIWPEVRHLPAWPREGADARNACWG